MIRSLSHRPLLFGILAWACIIALSADFANLDDLLTTGVVLHEDQDVLSGDQGSHGSTEQAFVPVVAKTLKLPACAVIDQDSPSPAPDAESAVLPYGQVFIEPAPFTPLSPLTGEALYIKHQSLLI
jgi:hypothetical protein